MQQLLGISHTHQELTALCHEIRLYAPVVRTKNGILRIYVRGARVESIHLEPGWHCQHTNLNAFLFFQRNRIGIEHVAGLFLITTDEWEHIVGPHALRLVLDGLLRELDEPYVDATSRAALHQFLQAAAHLLN
jgi:hypothetical protein